LGLADEQAQVDALQGPIAKRKLGCPAQGSLESLHVGTGGIDPGFNIADAGKLNLLIPEIGQQGLDTACSPRASSP
jgi:hypothetical protein